MILTATILIIIDLSIDWYNSFNKSVPKESEFLDVDSWRNQTLKQLKIECHLDSEGYVCGRVINNSADEVSFLKVSVRLINDQGNSIQADSGYVDGAEVSIKPGDSRPFCIHISNYKKNIDNISYSCEILDFH